MSILRIIEIIMPILLVGLAGYIFGKFRKVDLKTLADYIIYVGSPALALTMLSKQQMGLGPVLTIIFSASAVIIGAGIISYLLSKLFKAKAPAGFYLPVMFMNSGFIGYPLTLFIFGEAGFGQAIIYDLANALLIFTLGVFIISRGKDRWQVLKVPFVYAAALGILLSITGIGIPQALYSPLYLLSGTTIPIALFLVGCRLAYVNIRSFKAPLSAAILRFIIGLSLGLAVVAAFRLDGLIGKTILLLSTLPSAVTSIAIAEEYETDSELVASSIAVSTVLGILTIPLVLSWFIL